MELKGLRVTQTTYFSLLTHAKQLSFVTFCDATADLERNGSVTNGQTEGQTDVKSEIFI